MHTSAPNLLSRKRFVALQDEFVASMRETLVAGKVAQFVLGEPALGDAELVLLVGAEAVTHADILRRVISWSIFRLSTVLTPYS